MCVADRSMEQLVRSHTMAVWSVIRHHDTSGILTGSIVEGRGTSGGIVFAFRKYLTLENGTIDSES